MSSTSLLRPGIALGPYPQREDLRDSWLDRTAASLAGFIRQRVYGRSPGGAPSFRWWMREGSASPR
jgi:hypothetical protein